MHLVGSLLFVADMAASQTFFESLMGERLKHDLGACRQYESGLTLQDQRLSGELYGFPPGEIIKDGKNCVLYYETEDFLGFVGRLKAYGGIDYLHDVVTFDWGQQSISFYDPDKHIIDVSETMAAVCRRFYAKGMSPEEVAAKTEHSLEFVRSFME